MRTVFFALSYIALLIPTYVLPYFGSNSTLLNAASTATGLGPTPMWWMHAWCLAMLVIVAWGRGVRVEKQFLPVLSFVAALFDLTPVLSSIPFVPTILHIVVLILGITGKENGDSVSIAKRLVVAGIVATGITLAGIVTFVTTKPTVKAALPSVSQPSLPPAQAQPAAPAKAEQTQPEKVEQPKQHIAPAKPKTPAAQQERPAGKAGDSGTTVRYMKL